MKRREERKKKKKNRNEIEKEKYQIHKLILMPYAGDGF